MLGIFKKTLSSTARRRALIVLFAAALALLLFGLRALRQPRTAGVTFPTEADGCAAAAQIGNGAVILSGNRCALYDSSGSVLCSVPLRLQDPALCAGKSRALAYDIGGTACLLIQPDGTALAWETEAPISAATMNRRGRACVITLPDNCRALVTVYSSEGDEQFRYWSAEDGILSARVSPDGERLAVTSCTDSGSRTELISLQTGTTDAVFTVEDRAATEVLWLNDRRLVMLTASQALFFTDGGLWLGTFSFEGQALQAVAADESGLVTLALSPASAGINGTLYTLNAKGELLGTADYTGRLLSLQARHRRVLALDDAGLTLYRPALNSIASAPLRGFKAALLTGRRAALLTGDSTAEYYCF